MLINSYQLITKYFSEAVVKLDALWFWGNTTTKIKAILFEAIPQKGLPGKGFNVAGQSKYAG